jgi:hypothetical protein
MARHERIIEQLRRNAVALISLVVAVTGLTYNTWRNERTEYNRNQREAAFEILLLLAELDESVNFAHYDRQEDEPADLKTGWALVNTIDVLSAILDEPMPASGDRLVAIWESRSGGLGGATDGPVDAIRAEIDQLQKETVALIRSLD